MQKKTLLISTMALMLALSGCDSSGSNSSSSYNSAVEVSSSNDYSYEYDDTYADNNGGNATFDDYDDTQIDVRMIRRQGNITISSRDFDGASEALDTILKNYNTLITEDSTSKYDVSSYYNDHSRRITLRIENQNFEAFCDEIANSDAWEVIAINKSAEDITEQYNDNEEQIEVWRVRYEWYKEQAEQTDDPDLIHEYTESMFYALENIRQLENEQNANRQDVKYSTIHIELVEDTTMDDLDSSDGVWQSIIDHLTVLPKNIGAAFGYLILLIVTLLPAALVIALVVFGARAAHKLYVKQHPEAQNRVSKTTPKPEVPTDENLSYENPYEPIEIPQTSSVEDFETDEE